MREPFNYDVVELRELKMERGHIHHSAPLNKGVYTVAHLRRLQKNNKTFYFLL